MAKTPIDRRVARTRESLHRALFSLILKRSYDAITVEEICAAANVGRSTFYAHYAGKDNLKRSGLESLRRQLMAEHEAALAAPGRSKDQRLRFSLTLFEHARDHVDLYRALVGTHGGAVALGTIRQMIADLVRAELAATAGETAADAVPRELVVHYVVGAYMAVLTWWLDSGAKLPPQRIDALFRRLAMQGIRAAA